MEFLNILFNDLLYRPLFNLLVWIYNVIPGHDFGVAIILLTIIIRLLLFSLSRSSIETQKVLNELQPKIKEIQEKYKNDKEKQGVALMEIYKKNKVNPFSGFLAIIIQIPILIALYKVFLSGFDPEKLNGLYSFIINPGYINPMFFGIFDLSKSLPFLAVLAGIFQFIQSKMLMPKKSAQKGKTDNFMSLMSEQMLYMSPFITVIFAWKFPGGLALYWTINTIFSIVQQYLVFQKDKNKDNKYEGNDTKNN